MKVLVTIMVCKVLRIIGKIVGKGSSLPGKIALKICPDILERISLPKYIIAVTGSNGKTSTVEMIAHILMENGQTKLMSETLFRRITPFTKAMTPSWKGLQIEHRKYGINAMN